MVALHLDSVWHGTQEGPSVLTFPLSALEADWETTILGRIALSISIPHPGIRAGVKEPTRLGHPKLFIGTQDLPSCHHMLHSAFQTNKAARSPSKEGPVSHPHSGDKAPHFRDTNGHLYHALETST